MSPCKNELFSLSVKRDSVIARSIIIITSLYFLVTEISSPLTPLFPKTIQFFLRDTYHSPFSLLAMSEC